MASTLVFPDGIRLARKEEIPGPESRRSEAWVRVQSASIAPGYVLQGVQDKSFTDYAEVNVDAPQIWAVFRDLCHELLGPNVNLIAGEVDSDLLSIGTASLNSVMAALEPHQYQLSHDGFLQFGLLSNQEGEVNEVFVAPAKHLKVWMTNDEKFRRVMERHNIQNIPHLEFLDQYPRTTVALPDTSSVVQSRSDLFGYLENKIAVARNLPN